MVIHLWAPWSSVLLTQCPSVVLGDTRRVNVDGGIVAARAVHRTIGTVALSCGCRCAAPSASLNLATQALIAQLHQRFQCPPVFPKLAIPELVELLELLLELPAGFWNASLLVPVPHRCGRVSLTINSYYFVLTKMHYILV